MNESPPRLKTSQSGREKHKLYQWNDTTQNHGTERGRLVFPNVCSPPVLLGLRQSDSHGTSLHLTRSIWKTISKARKIWHGESSQLWVITASGHTSGLKGNDVKNTGSAFLQWCHIKTRGALQCSRKNHHRAGVQLRGTALIQQVRAPGVTPAPQSQNQNHGGLAVSGGNYISSPQREDNCDNLADHRSVQDLFLISPHWFIIPAMQYHLQEILKLQA